MTRPVAPGIGVGWSEAKPFGCAESVDSGREVSVTRVHDVRTSDDLSVLKVPESVSDLAVGSLPKENAFP